MSESLGKKNPVSGPSGREHPHVKYNLLLLIVLVTSKLAPEQNYSAARLELKYLKICQNHQRDPVSGPFSFFFNNKMEHPRIEKETRKKQERGNHEPLVSLKRPGSEIDTYSLLSIS